MSHPIDDATLADLYAVALPSGAAHRRAAADAATAEALGWAGWPDAVRAVLAEVPEPTGQIHDGGCWKRHAPCLASKLLDLMP
jgi:hypothetical protein